jgi:hypothetical protein
MSTGGNTETSTCQLHMNNFFCADSKMEWNINLLQHHYLMRGQNCNSSPGWCGETATLYSEGLLFGGNYGHISRQCRWNDCISVCSSSHTINGRGSKSVVMKTSGSEKT